MKALCNKCKHYEVEGNDTKCQQRVWQKATLSKSKIYNALMFECIDHERPLQPFFILPDPIPS